MKNLNAPSFASFSKYDLVKALLLISEAPLGRNQLMKILGLSEASTRSLMKKLSSAKFAKATTKGLSLTDNGKKFVKELKTFLSGPAQIKYGNFSVAFKVVNSAGLVNLGLEQRDAAISKGAGGCLVLVFRNNRLIMPGVEGLENAYLNVFTGIRENFKLAENDAIVIAFADEKRKAELGAWAAAETLLSAVL